MGRKCRVCGFPAPPEGDRCEACGAPLPPEEPPVPAPESVPFAPESKSRRWAWMAGFLAVCLAAQLLGLAHAKPPAGPRFSAYEGRGMCVYAALDHRGNYINCLATTQGRMRLGDTGWWAGGGAPTGDRGVLVTASEVWVCQDGTLFRKGEEWTGSAASGAGDVVFYTTQNGGVSTLWRWALGEEPLELDRGESLTIHCAAWDGSAAGYLKRESAGDMRQVCVWSARGIQTVVSGRENGWVGLEPWVSKVGKDGKSVLVRTHDYVTHYEYSSSDVRSRTVSEHILVWLDGPRPRTRELSWVVCSDRDLEEIIYIQEGEAFYETMGKKPRQMELPQESLSLTALAPNGAVTEPERLLGWVYAEGPLYSAISSVLPSWGRNIYWLGEDLTLTRLASSDVLFGCAVDMDGGEMAYISGGELYLMALPDGEPRQLTRTGTVGFLFSPADPEPEYYYHLDTPSGRDWALYRTDREGESQLLMENVTQAQPIRGGGCWFLREGNELWFAPVHDPLRKAENFPHIPASQRQEEGDPGASYEPRVSLYPFGDGTRALATWGERAWLLSGDGTAVELEELLPLDAGEETAHI